MQNSSEFLCFPEKVRALKRICLDHLFISAPKKDQKVFKVVSPAYTG